MANIAWAIANFGWCNKPLLSAISSAALPTIDDYQPQNLANTAWALAKIVVRDEPLFDAIASAFLARISEFD